MKCMHLQNRKMRESKRPPTLSSPQSDLQISYKAAVPCDENTIKDKELITEPLVYSSEQSNRVSENFVGVADC
jgi:hypothetical protein